MVLIGNVQINFGAMLCYEASCPGWLYAEWTVKPVKYASRIHL